MAGTLSSPSVDSGAVRRVVVETPRHRVTGDLRLPPDGYRSRLSDYLNAPDRAFLPLTAVTLESLDGSRGVEEHEFVAVATAHVIMVIPAEPRD